MRTIKRLALAVILLFTLVLVAWFASLNPGSIKIDLAFGVIEPPVSLAFAVTFLFGWLFGISCIGFYVMRIAAERRRLKSELQVSQSEVSSLRSLPIADAD